MEIADKKSKTAICLMKGFVGEGAARNRYTYFAKNAKKEGFEQIAAFFEETAENEVTHAKMFFKHLGKDFLPIMIDSIAYPAGLNDSTEKNLQFAANGEHEENTILYPSFAKIAEEEGYKEIAETFKEITEVEVIHERRFLDLMENIKEKRVFKRENEVIWKCRHCGYHFKGKEAPEKCPACKHPQSYYEMFVKNY